MLQAVGSSVCVPESKSGSSRGSAHLYQNLALLECADASTLDEVTAGPLGRYVVRRLSDTIAVVDHAHLDLLVKTLEKSGYTPRVSGVSGEERR